MNTILHWMRRSPLQAYFVLVFAIEWLLFLALAKHTPPLIALMVGSWLPNCAGVLVTGTWLGKQGLRKLFQQVILWRVGLVWYAAAVLLPAAASILAIGLNNMAGGQPAGFATLQALPLIFLGALFTGAMGEELGWCGTCRRLRLDTFHTDPRTSCR